MSGAKGIKVARPRSIRTRMCVAFPEGRDTSTRWPKHAINSRCQLDKLNRPARFAATPRWKGEEKNISSPLVFAGEAAFVQHGTLRKPPVSFRFVE